jgi:thiol-disulfide isomerase/thioredoxin
MVRAAGRVDGLQIVPVDGPGVKRLVAAARGRVILVNFWATWCAPCKEEFPDLLRLRKELSAGGLEVILVSIDDQRDTAAQVQSFLRGSGVEFPVYIKRKGHDEEFINTIDPRWSGALPATFIYDRNGRMVQSLVDRQTYDGMLRRLKPLLSQKP